MTTLVPIGFESFFISKKEEKKMEQKLSEQELVRRQKMEDLRAKGIDPFGDVYKRQGDECGNG